MDARTPESQDDELDHVDGPRHAQTSVIRRACDSCRTRKIRCDRKDPCAQCVNSKITCTHASKRPKERRARIHVSSQYEQKIDTIDRRLEEVTRMLHEMSTDTKNNPFVKKEVGTQDKQSQSCMKTLSGSSDRLTPLTSDGPVYEGESPMDLHSIFSHKFLENIIQNTSCHEDNSAIWDTMNSLHHAIIGLKHQTAVLEIPYPMAKSVVQPSLSGLKMPPIQRTVSVVRRAKSDQENTGMWMFCFPHINDLMDICLNVYFSTDYSLADLIISNSGLYSLFWERAHSIPAEKDECLKYVDLCKKNLETALSSLPLYLPATPSMIDALLLGAFHAVEISKPSLSWILTSKAAELCMTLGYNRLPTKDTRGDREHEMKLYLFWSVYYMDKTLSLRLGRATTIPDWNIETTLPSQDNMQTIPHSSFTCQWVRTARCQGQIYENLYSPYALSQSYELRKDRVRVIVQDLKEIRAETANLNKGQLKKLKSGEEVMLAEFLLVSDDVFRLSLLTLALRASPPSPEACTTFIPECVEAARATLRRHQQCMELVQNSHELYFATYLHWTLLSAPFVPFIVLFCQVIETHNREDLASLEGFIASTESAPTVSDAAAKMHRLFQVLYRVAQQYIECTVQAPVVDQTMDNDELNNYLTGLGLLPLRMEQQQAQAPAVSEAQNIFADELIDPALRNTQGQRVANPMLWMSNTAQLEDWFQSNQQMMDLMEEPNPGFPS